MPISENSKLMKFVYTAQEYSHQSLGHSDIPVKSYEFNGGQQKSVPAQNSTQQSKIFLCFCILN